MRIIYFIAAAALTLTAHAQSGSATSEGAAQMTGNAAGQSINQTANSAANATASKNGASATAQQAGATAANLGNSSASAAQASNLSAELTKGINSKNAKVGDEVIARTTSNAQLADGTRLPKGSRLVGKVTDVQAESSADHASHLAFAFDHAVLHDGRQIPIHAALQSISAPINASAMSSQDDSLAAGPVMAAPAGGMRSAGSSGGRGGLLGGAGSAVGSAGGLVGGAANNVGNTVGNGVHSLGSNVGAVGANTINATNGSVSTSHSASAGLVTSPVSNIPGITFGSAASGNNSAVLNGAGRNVQLSSGTQMTLNLSTNSQ